MIRYYITDHQTESLYHISHEYCETREDRSSSSGYSFFFGRGRKTRQKILRFTGRNPRRKKKEENLFVISSHSGQKDDEKAGNRNKSGSPPSWTKDRSALSPEKYRDLSHFPGRPAARLPKTISADKEQVSTPREYPQVPGGPVGNEVMSPPACTPGGGNYCWDRSRGKRGDYHREGNRPR